MPSKSIVANQQEPCPHTSPLSAVCSEQWWLSAGYDPVPSAHAGELGHLDKTARSKDEKSPSNARAKNDDEFGGNFRTIGSMQPDGNFDEDSDKLQGQRSSMPLGSSDIPQPPQLELVGHSIACATTPYPDVYYGGIMAAGGPQPLVHPQFYGMHQPMTPFPLEMTQEPIYVNAKQYHAILRRRQSRAKAELERKLIKERKPYLHESRHQHALRRARGSGGRFAKKGEVESQATTSTEERVKSSGSALSLQSAGSSGSETKAADSTESWNSKSSDEHTNRQWGSVSSVQPRQRALAI